MKKSLFLIVAVCAFCNAHAADDQRLYNCYSVLEPWVGKVFLTHSEQKSKSDTIISIDMEIKGEIRRLADMENTNKAINPRRINQNTIGTSVAAPIRYFCFPNDMSIDDAIVFLDGIYESEDEGKKNSLFPMEK